MLKIKQGYALRKIATTYLIVGIGAAAYQPYTIMSLNETGVLLWHKLENGADRETLISALLDEYEVSSEQAAQDVDRFLNQLNEKELTEAC